MSRPVVEIEVNNVEGRILTQLAFPQLSVISERCSFRVEGAEYKSNNFRSRRRGSFEWDGYRRLFNISNQKFPIGLLNRIMELFDTVGYDIILYDNRKHMKQQFKLECNDIESRDYQNWAVIQSVIHGSGIIKAATGSGKTTIACKTQAAIGKPAVFIVHTKDLLYQAKQAFERMLEIKIGQIGDGIIDLENYKIVVATVQTLAKASSMVHYEAYKYDEDMDEEDNTNINPEKRRQILKWAKTVGIVQFDEVQRVASRTAYSARFMFPWADNTFGYSASPWRDDGADLMIEAAFGPRIVDITATSLINKGYLVQPIIEIIQVQNNVWSGDNYNTIYKTAIVENMFRNMQVVNDAIRHYKAGRSTLILVTQIKHGKIIENMVKNSGYPGVFISGKSGISKRKQVIEDMRKGKAPLVIASTIADVGLDVPRLQAIVEAGAGKSSVTALQRLGRIMRKFPGKEECYFTTYRDTAPYICRHIDSKLKIWRTEPAFIIKEG